MDERIGQGRAAGVPECPADGIRMVDTIVGWRCPVCGAPNGYARLAA